MSEQQGSATNIDSAVTEPAKAAPVDPRSRALAKWAELEGPEAPTPKSQQPIVDPPKVADDKQEPAKADDVPLKDDERIAALARREKYEREQRERRWAQREEQLRAREAELAARAERYLDKEELSLELQRDPAGALRKLGLSKLSDVAKALWLEEIGDAAPKEHKADVRMARFEAELKARDAKIAKLEQEMRQREEHMRGEKMISDYQGEMRSVFAGADKPHVKAMMAHDPDGLVREAWDAAVAYVQANPEADFPTPNELLEFMESQLEYRAKPFRAMMSSTQSEQAAQKGETASSPTLSDKTAAPTRATPTARSLDEVKAKLKEDLERVRWDWE